MLYAKLTTPITYVDQLDPLAPVTKSATHFNVKANQYQLGSNAAVFTAIFGSVELDQNDQIISFSPIFQVSQELSGTALSGWGTDDSVIFSAIAEAKSISIDSFVNV